MEERSASPPVGNIVMFVAVVLFALVAYPWLMNRFFPQPAQPKVPDAPVAQDLKKDKPADKSSGDKLAGDKKPEPQKALPAEQPKSTAEKEVKAAGPPGKAVVPANAADPAKKAEPRQWVTLGSADPDPTNPFRMLVTLSNEGASVARIELSSEHYRDLEDRGGYLGHLVMDDTDRGPGCLVQVVGAGTPAAAAGAKAGDRILELVYRGQTVAINSPGSLEDALGKVKPGETVELAIRRGQATLPNVKVTLIRRPLEVIRPERKKPNLLWVKNGPLDALDLEENSPLSFLATLQSVDQGNPKNLRPDFEEDAKWDEELKREMPGVELRGVNWHIDNQAAEQNGGPITKVTFSCPVPEYHLTITKSYELVKVEGDPAKELDAKAYHLVLTLQVINNDSKKHEVAYRLDGPNGLPVEGSWYVTTKVGRGWAAEGLRDVDFELAKGAADVATATQLADKFYKNLGEATEFSDHPPQFFAVDAQYFTVAMLPEAQATATNIDRAIGLRVGDVAELRKTLTNTSFRLISKMMPLEANGGKSPEQTFDVFAGPKRPALLEQYTLLDSTPANKSDLSVVICYGWPIFKYVARPMTWILDKFYLIVHNYGLAIIMLTVVVRLAFYPVSRQQTRSQQLMQTIQPKLKELEKKHKGDWKALQQARQEVLAKHNYNPSSGCVLLILQLPVFIGLYRALQVNVELRGAPLISSAVRWCSNLAAPDMLWDWSWLMPNAVNNGIGFPSFPLFGSMLGMGPYLNLFPIITMGLFLLQQKIMMPPAADEQMAQQQKIMKYVMFLMAFMFFKVAAGLCIYFIATTLWGLAEKRFMPKPAIVDGGSDEDGVPSRPFPKPDRPSTAERDAIRRKKLGGKK